MPMRIRNILVATLLLAGAMAAGPVASAEWVGVVEGHANVRLTLTGIRFHAAVPCNSATAAEMIGNYFDQTRYACQLGIQAAPTNPTGSLNGAGNNATVSSTFSGTGPVTVTTNPQDPPSYETNCGVQTTNGTDVRYGYAEGEIKVQLSGMTGRTIAGNVLYAFSSAVVTLHYFQLNWGPTVGDGIGTGVTIDFSSGPDIPYDANAKVVFDAVLNGGAPISCGQSSFDAVLTIKATFNPTSVP